MKESKYAILAARLREDIRSGTFPPGSKLPSENELTVSTGYSRQTVRQAMSLLENEGLTDRVRGSGTYVRSVAIQRETTKNIAVVTTYIGEYIFPAILHGIDSVLSQNGYTSMLAATRNRVDNERRILTELLTKPIDGLIVEGTKTALPNPNIDLYDEFRRQGIPVVFFNGFYPDLSPKPLYIVADDRAGGHTACQLLLDQKLRRIGCIFKSDDIQGLRRYAGYTEAMRSAGCMVSDDLMVWYTTENRERLVAAELPRLLDRCDGLICYNDEVALQCLRLMTPEQTQRVPLVSFDNSTYAQLSPTPFLSLESPKERIGQLAAETLLSLLSGIPCQSVVLPWHKSEPHPF